MLQGWTWLMSVTCHVVSQVSSLLTLLAPCYWWLCLHMLPLHVWRCTAMLCQLTGRFGGLVEPSAWPAAQLGRSIMAWRELVMLSWSAQEKQDLAGLLLRGTLLRHVAAAYILSPCPSVTAPQKAAALPHALKQMKPERSERSRLVLLSLTYWKRKLVHTGSLCTLPHTSQQPTYQPHSIHKAEAHLPVVLLLTVAQYCCHLQGASAAIFSA